MHYVMPGNREINASTIFKTNFPLNCKFTASLN